MKNTFPPIKYFLIVFFAFLQTLTSAQESRWRLGAEAGPALISLRGNDLYGDHNPTLGFSAGMTAEYTIDHLVSIRTGLAFDRKGDEEYILFTDNTGNVLRGFFLQMRRDYITLPVLFRVSFGRRTRFFINAGPYVGFFLNEDVFVKENQEISDNFPNRNELYNTFDFGFSGGIGIGIPLGEKLEMAIEIREKLGLTELYRPEEQDYYGNYKTNALSLLIGLAYHLN